jgi:hypothetical protein
LCSAEESVRHYNKARPEWRKQHIVRRTREALNNTLVDDANAFISMEADSHECQQCSGICYKVDGSYRSFSTTAKTCLETIFCPAVIIPELELPKLDKNGYDAADGETVQLSSFRKECCYGTHVGLSPNMRHDTITTWARKCGWDFAFQYVSRGMYPLVLEVQCIMLSYYTSLPISNLVFTISPQSTLDDENILTGKITQHSMRACPDEFTEHQFVYKKWQTVARPSRNDESGETEDGTYGDNGVATQEEWLPYIGTRKTFMIYLKQSIEIYARHQWKVRHDRQARLREQ